MSAELAREDDAGSEVIAVAEAAGDAEDLEIGESCGVFKQSIEVQAFGLGPGEFEGPGGFDVAVGAWVRRTQTLGVAMGYTVEFREVATRGLLSGFGVVCTREGDFSQLLPSFSPDSGRALAESHSRLESWPTIFHNTAFGSSRSSAAGYWRFAGWPAADPGLTDR